jgi:hypothetical protein
MRYLAIFGILAFLASPAMGVMIMHDLDAYTAGQPLDQAGGAFTALGTGTTGGSLDIIDVGGAHAKVVKVTGNSGLGTQVASTGPTGAGDVGRLAGMLYAGFDLYCPDPVVGSGNNIWDFQLQDSASMVFHAIGSPDTGYMRDPYMAMGSFSVSPGWHSAVIANYSDGTAANSYVDLIVDGILIDHITPATAGYGIWPALASNAAAKAQQLRIQTASRTDGGICYLDNIWGGNTPEPASLALFGLGGLLFLRRRRA